jgi:hypothetical protein
MVLSIFQGGKCTVQGASQQLNRNVNKMSTFVRNVVANCFVVVMHNLFIFRANSIAELQQSLKNSLPLKAQLLQNSLAV